MGQLEKTWDSHAWNRENYMRNKTVGKGVRLSVIKWNHQLPTETVSICKEQSVNDCIRHSAKEVYLASLSIHRKSAYVEHTFNIKTQ